MSEDDRHDIPQLDHASELDRPSEPDHPDESDAAHEPHPADVTHAPREPDYAAEPFVDTGDQPRSAGVRLWRRATELVERNGRSERNGRARRNGPAEPTGRGVRNGRDGRASSTRSVATSIDLDPSVPSTLSDAALDERRAGSVDATRPSAASTSDATQQHAGLAPPPPPQVIPDEAPDARPAPDAARAPVAPPAPADSDPLGLDAALDLREQAPAGAGEMGAGGPTEPPEHPTPTEWLDGDVPEPPRGRPRVKKLRLLALLVPLSLLAVVSTIYGMIVAVSSDIPALENRAEYKAAKNSILYDDNGKPLGILTGNLNRILVTGDQISLLMKHAIVAVEDRRFYGSSGVDIQSIARALLNDTGLGSGGTQGASTITEQFVKNALQAQNKRTIFQKMREAAIAYHLTHKWSKDKILTEYLNTIYFGNGAYGIESAARTYFGWNHPGCGTDTSPCASVLTAPEAALLAGMVSSPYAYDPASHPPAAEARRNLVLQDMLGQGYITQAEYDQYRTEALPAKQQIQLPQQKSQSPYFTSWVQQQIVDKYGPIRAFDGGLKIHTTLDLNLQQAAQAAVNTYLSDPTGPQAAMVAIDNHTGEVRAMVGGNDYQQHPFNLATEGQRQPGSAFKVFVLAQALKEGISPGSVWPSRKRIFVVPHTHGKEFFIVRDYESNYYGSNTLADATTLSDNAVFAAVGITAGPPRIAGLAQRMGIRTHVSHNYAITLGGLRQGVTPLDMAHAYETLAHGGLRVNSPFSPSGGPSGIHYVQFPNGRIERNNPSFRRVLSPSLVSTENSILQTVVSNGTGKQAAWGGYAAGKTGTTENYGDAWFVGFTNDLTVAVWVGYPDSTKSMKFAYGGSPVAGGTYPAQIWHDFIVNAEGILQAELAARSAGKKPPVNSAGLGGSGSGSYGTGSGTSSSLGSSGGGSGSSGGGGSPRGGGGTGGGGGGGGRTGGGGGGPTATPAPAAPTPSPAPSPPSGGGGGGGGSGGAAGGSGGAAAPTH